MKKTLVLLLATAMIVTSMAGCGKKDDTNSSNEVSSSSTVESSQVSESKTEENNEDAERQEIINLYMERANEVQINENDVTFMDDSGRTEPLTIPKNPKRPAVLYGSHACLWTEAGGKVALGIGGKSAVSLYKDQIGHNILEDEGVITVAESSSGKSWDVETILAQKPDLIICSTRMNGYATISGPAEAAGIPVVAINYSGLEDYLRWFKVFSNLNVKPELWDEIAQGVLDQVVDVVMKAPKENNPKVLSIIPKADKLDANTSMSNTGALLEELNAINIADPNNDSTANTIEISLEEIYKEDPDYILIQCVKSEEDARNNLEANVNGNPVWDSLKAVKENKVFYLQKDLFQYRPNRRYGESYKVLAELIYPDMSF